MKLTHEQVASLLDGALWWVQTIRSLNYVVVLIDFLFQLFNSIIHQFSIYQYAA